MGWTEGTGLGKRRDGTVDHIRIKQREDEAGLGRERELHRAVGDVWWKESVGGTLARLQKNKQSKKKDSKKKKKKSSKKDELTIKTFTDEELFQATGGARFGMRAQRRAEGKWKRTESGEELALLNEKAAAGMEWNGRGEAKVVVVAAGGAAGDDVDKKDGKKRKRRSTDDEDAGERSNGNNTEVDESEKKRLKKLRKEEKRRDKEAHKVSDEDDEAVVGGGGEKKDKKNKKKKSKKSS